MGSPPALFTLCEIAAKKFKKKWSAIDTHTQDQSLLLCSYHGLGRKGDQYYKLYAMLEFRLQGVEIFIDLRDVREKIHF